ncbi:hypothetical protein BJ741DRAFT_622859 [Chytriomyces cf. hyalinus JEL632]|nr:hypothetical protein BJ741DRAFT_622859 [Chytriomyces cf. hyalinus JEL632]
MTRPNPCERCRQHRKKCDTVRPVCSRCFKANAQCGYDDDLPDSCDPVDPEPSEQERDSVSIVNPAPPAPPSTSILSKIVDAADCSMILDFNVDPVPPLLQEHQHSVPPLSETSLPFSSSEDYSYSVNNNVPMPTAIPGVNLNLRQDVLPPTITSLDPLIPQQQEQPLSVMDPDMIPTISDYMLVAGMFDKQSKHPMIRLFDRDAILNSFFFLEPALRLSLCAKAAQFEYQSVSSKQLLSYFRRARNAVGKSLDRASLETLQALHLVRNLANLTGQSAFSVLLYGHILNMMRVLRMDQDPDTLPDRSFLPERTKTEFRNWFWILAQGVLSSGAYGITYFKSTFRIDAVKHVATRLYSPKLCWRYHTIMFVRCMYSRAPRSVMDVIWPRDWFLAGAKLSKCLTDSSDCMFKLDGTFTEYSHVLVEKLNISVMAAELLIDATVEYYASICMLHRPRLYLLGFLTPQSVLLEDPKCAAELMFSLEQCILACGHVLRVFRFLALCTRDYAPTSRGFGVDAGWEWASRGAWLEEGADLVPQVFSPDDYTWSLALSLFEAAIVLWVLGCKVHPDWKTGGGRVVQIPPMEELVEGLMFALEWLRMIDGNLLGHAGVLRATWDTRQNYVSPMILCVESMLLEMRTYHAQNDIRIHNAEIAMTVLSLTEDGSDDLKAIKDDEYPVAFMGLLGLQVMGGIRWKGPYEEDWRRFWNTPVHAYGGDGGSSGIYL